jgi:hypothetical protein
MNRINAADREKQSRNLKQKHELGCKAKAEAESKRLQGRGIADQRNCQRVEWKCRCTKQSWYQLSKSALIVVTQHYDTLQAMS